MRMRRIILSSVACLAVPYFSTLSHKLYDVLKKRIERKMCVVILSITFVSSISHSKKNRARCYYKGTQVVCFLLGNSPASEFYMPTFRNILSVPSSQASRCIITKFEKSWGIHTGGLARKQPEPIGRRVTSAYKNSEACELTMRTHTTYRTRRKFEIKNA